MTASGFVLEQTQQPRDKEREHGPENQFREADQNRHKPAPREAGCQPLTEISIAPIVALDAEFSGLDSLHMPAPHRRDRRFWSPGALDHPFFERLTQHGGYLTL